MGVRPRSFEEWRDDIASKMESSPLWNSIGYQNRHLLLDNVTTHRRDYWTKSSPC
jgi:hypothetical protein